MTGKQLKKLEAELWKVADTMSKSCKESFLNAELVGIGVKFKIINLFIIHL